MVEIVATPSDVVKVLVKAHVYPVVGHNASVEQGHVDNSPDAFRKKVRADGMKGRWRELNATLILAISTIGLCFSLYEAI